jgi:hypothetical protein
MDDFDSDNDSSDSDQSDSDATSDTSDSDESDSDGITSASADARVKILGWLTDLTRTRIKGNDPQQKSLTHDGNTEYIESMADEEWEELGRDIANNTNLEDVNLNEGTLNDQSMTFLFRGLTRSSSIFRLELHNNGLSIDGVRSMVPFLQNSNRLRFLNLDYNYLHSESFKVLFHALRDSPIESLYFNECCIETIEIDSGEHIPGNLRLMSLIDNRITNVDGLVRLLQNANNLMVLYLGGNQFQSRGFNTIFRALDDSSVRTLCAKYCDIESIEIEYIPRHLKNLHLEGNKINSDECRVLLKLLQEGTGLHELNLDRNEIDDEGVEILLGALRNNTSLEELHLCWNEGITIQGKTKLLKLVNDVSSIRATLQSNHTLTYLGVEGNFDEQIQMLISDATEINRNAGSPEAAGREKVIWTQLNSKKRAQLASLQGVNQSLYSEIDPLHLPEILALVYEYHGLGEFYLALKSSIAGVISTVNRKEPDTEPAAIEEAGGREDDGGRNKRHRVCYDGCCDVGEIVAI